MNKKVSLLIITIILTLIVFGISTYMQKKLVNYIPTIKCMIVTKDIEANEKIDEDDIEIVDMPVAIITKVRTVQDISEVKELYLKDKIYKGQIVLYSQFDTKENLMIYKADEGKEKISIKIKNAENGVSYTLRENSIVNVYATLRSEYASNIGDENIKQIGVENDSYSVIKVLENIKILGTFDVNGEPINSSQEKNIDTILLAVTPEEAKNINLIRDIATFNITEI